MRFNTFLLSACTAVGLSMALPACADTITVNATDNIYGADQLSIPGGGTAPDFINFSVAGITSVTFSSVTGSITAGCASSEGCITVNGGTLNDPDGVGAATATSSNTGNGNISGITAPGAGYLVGLFVPDGGTLVPATALNYTTTSSTSSASYSPGLDQTFFIGDGLTGDGSGSQQVFNVPFAAGGLFLGISDACGYNGPPGCFGDNYGSYSINYSLNGIPSSGAPEPASLALFGSGLASLFFLRNRKKA